MTSSTPTLSLDTDIVHWLVHNEIAGWDMLYDKYSSMMYGVFYRVYKNTNQAETAFIACFLELTHKKTLLIAQSNLCLFLVRYVGAYMRQNLNKEHVVVNISEGFALNTIPRNTC